MLGILAAGAMGIPLVISWIYEDGQGLSFLLPMLGVLVPCLCLVLLLPRQERELSRRDAFLIVTLGWVTVAFIGSLPFLFGGVFSSFTDAYFETISGFTTTGATVLAHIESLPRGLLFWRSFIQWLGGMGIILFSIAILPLLGVGGMELYKAEVPGPAPDKLKPRIAETAKALWKVYVSLTLLEVVLLSVGGMDLFDSLCHAFTTLATGGFSTKDTSIEHFRRPYFEAVIMAFMLLAGINFSLHHRLGRFQLKEVWKNSELRFYLCVVLMAVCLVTWNLCSAFTLDLAQSLRLGSFHVISILTTTGYSSTDFEKWPLFSQYLLLMLMFVGGSAGSTGGGVKCVRVMLLIKQGYREFYRLIHPRAVLPVKLGGRTVPPSVLQSVWGFFILYLFVFVAGSAAMFLVGLDLPTSISSVVASLSNVGPGLGAVGPSDNYSAIPVLGKWVLIFCMLVGRLEIYTVLILFVPEFWRR
jgi:trk system potassium uptake protein TrkH